MRAISKTFLVTLAIGAAGALGLACSTSTPIGEVPDASGGSPGTAVGSGGTAGLPGGAAGVGGGAGLPGYRQGSVAGMYVPSGDQVLNDPPFANPADVSGDWVGYVENGTPGSEEVLLRFGTDAQGHATLSVKRGTVAVPAAPTDRLQRWPSVASNADAGVFIDGGGQTLPYDHLPMLGFTSVGHGVTWTGARLRFSTLDYEPWGPWCALQIPYEVDGQVDIYNCSAPSETVCGAGGCHTVGDPTHWEMCNWGYCGCNATGCGANVQPTTSYDITFFGDHAIGQALRAGGKDSIILMPAPK